MKWQGKKTMGAALRCVSGLEDDPAYSPQR